MGNQVIIAIRHDIDQNNIPEFSNQELMGLHEGERVPKSFITHNGIIVSHYYHSQDKVCLLVNNDFMARPIAYLDMYQKTSDGSENDIVKTIVSDYRKFFYKNIKKSKEQASPEEKGQTKVSLFGYLTDHTYEVPEDAFKLMVKAMLTMDELQNDEAKVVHWQQHVESTPILKIGTIDSDQMAFVELYGNLFTVIAKQRNKIESLAHLETREEKIVDFDTKLFKSFGYDITV